MISRVGLGTVGALIGLIFAASPASADCHGQGDSVGSGTTYVGNYPSSQTFSWNVSTRQAFVGSDPSTGMSTNNCLDSYVDWITLDGHYDRRVARSCQPGAGYGGTWFEPAGWAGRIVTGLQKAAGCKFKQTDPPQVLDCVYDSESFINPSTGTICYFPVLGQKFSNKCHAIFMRFQDGTVDSNNGGDAASCTS